MLELRRHEGVADSNHSVHDGVDSAEIGVATGSQAWKGKAAVRQDDPGVECADAPIFQTAQVGNRVFGSSGVFPSDGGSAGYGGRFRDEIG